MFILASSPWPTLCGLILIQLQRFNNCGMSNNKIDAQVKQITYQTCELDGHETEPLSRVCIDKDCKHKTLICSICEQERHKDHETTPLKSFLVRFYASEKEKKSLPETANPLYYASKIDEIKNSFFSTISQFKTELNESLNELEAKAKAYFNQMSQKLLMLVQFENPFNVLRTQGISQVKLKKYFEQILEHVKIKEKFSLSEKLSSLLKKGQEKEKILSTTLGKIKGEAFDFLGKLEKSLEPTSLNSIEKTVFTWSEELKGTKMKINGNIAEQTGMESSGQRFIMLEPCLADISDGKIRWGIKVIKFVGWIGVGMCLKNVITKANFFFNYSTIGHGSYMISNNGYSWSHSASEWNSAHKTFHYAQNDIVYMEYDRLAKKLRFRKNQSAEKFELDIVDPPLGDSYYPCANICSTGDAIEVINPGIELS